MIEYYDLEEEYAIGSGEPVPEWCRKFLTPFRADGGEVEYEYLGKFRSFSLKKGDILRIRRGFVEVVRQEDMR